MALVAMSLLFMLEERIAQKDDYPLLSCSDIEMLLKTFLPRRDLERDEVIRQMEKRHRQRRAATAAAYAKQGVSAPFGELFANLVYDLGARVCSGGFPLLHFGIWWVVRHRNPVFITRPSEQLGHFLGGTDASPGLGRLLAHLEGEAEEGECGRRSSWSGWRDGAPWRRSTRSGRRCGRCTE